jgi:hypothetical protein
MVRAGRQSRLLAAASRDMKSMAKAADASEVH